MNILDNELLSVDDVLLAPNHGIINSRSEAKLRPFIYSAPMDTVSGVELCKELLRLGEIPVLCRNLPKEEYKAGILLLANTPGFIAVGATQEEMLRFFTTVLEMTDEGLFPQAPRFNIAIDIAHGDSVVGHTASSLFRDFYYVDRIMSGSIATPEAAERCLQAGCTDLRVGIGVGAACMTRVKTGIGVPQLSAVYLIARELKKRYPQKTYTIIADGGIDSPGKAVKYICAGADAVMMGNVLSHTRESYGWTESDFEGLPQLSKCFRGHASQAFMTEHKKKNHCPEGVSSSRFYWDGLFLEDVVLEYRGGMSSAISYLGFNSMDSLSPETVAFLKISHATYMEGLPHV